MTRDTAAAAFWTDGYRVVDALLTAEQCVFFAQAINRSRNAGKMRVADHRVYRGPNNQYSPVPVQIFLHYVVADGPYAALVHDECKARVP